MTVSFIYWGNQFLIRLNKTVYAHQSGWRIFIQISIVFSPDDPKVHVSYCHQFCIPTLLYIFQISHFYQQLLGQLELRSSEVMFVGYSRLISHLVSIWQKYGHFWFLIAETLKIIFSETRIPNDLFICTNGILCEKSWI